MFVWTVKLLHSTYWAGKIAAAGGLVHMQILGLRKTLWAVPYQNLFPLPFLESKHSTDPHFYCLTVFFFSLKTCKELNGVVHCCCWIPKIWILCFRDSTIWRPSGSSCLLHRCIHWNTYQFLWWWISYLFLTLKLTSDCSKTFLMKLQWPF